MRNIFPILLILLFASCEGETSTTANNGFAKTLTEDQVISNTMNEFIGDPKTQDEIDKNIILNHIIDNQLDMKSTPDGIFYQITKEGTGSNPTLQDVIVVNYHGTFLDGKIFDSKMKKNDPFVYPLKRVNDGWQKAIPMLKAGSRGTFIIPSKLCYGEQGFGDQIPPHAILKFDIELLGVKTK